MIRYCHIKNCDDSANIFVRGHWYCAKHKPVMFTDETIRLHNVERGNVL